MFDKSRSSLPPVPPESDGASYADRRDQFEQLSNSLPVTPDAERAFLAGKIELIRSTPGLSDEEKDRAIDELQSRLRVLAGEDGPRSG